MEAFHLLPARYFVLRSGPSRVAVPPRSQRLRFTSPVGGLSDISRVVPRAPVFFDLFPFCGRVDFRPFSSLHLNIPLIVLSPLCPNFLVFLELRPLEWFLFRAQMPRPPHHLKPRYPFRRLLCELYFWGFSGWMVFVFFVRFTYWPVIAGLSSVKPPHFGPDKHPLFAWRPFFGTGGVRFQSPSSVFWSQPLLTGD